MYVCSAWTIGWYIIEINNREILRLQSEIRSEIPDHRAESSIFCSLEIPREVPQCSTKSSRFQSPTVNRVFRVAAGTTSVGGKKGLKTAGRVSASSKGMSLLTPAMLFLLHWKFEAKELRRGEKLQVFANGPRRWNQSFVEGAAFLHFPVCSNVTYFLSVSSTVGFHFYIFITRISKEIRWRTSRYFRICQTLTCFY